MSEKILKTEKFTITRNETNFDRACDSAYERTMLSFKIDDCGHSTIKGWERSRCFIRVVFEGYKQIGSMAGHAYLYTFRGEAVRGN